ncbi:MAG: c-type cytochrome [Mariprofundus sp.]
MKKNVWLILLAPLLFAACQDNNTAAQKATQPAVAEQSAQMPAQEHPTEPGDQAAADSNPVHMDAAAVTKPEKSTVAATVQQSMAENKAAAAVSASDLVAESKTAATETVKATSAPRVASAATEEPAAAGKPAASETPVVAAAVQAVAGDAAKGKSVANKCKTCHNFTAKKKVGPGLEGVFGRKAGAMPDMKYGAALAAGGWVWDEKNLAAWVCDSRKAVKSLSGDPAAKTKMPPQRICDATKQADLIAYLKTL